ncbi:MAG TPA: ABC transporter substrate-binding protein, partial [Aquaticitalea sp.]|nr:ABC transporter substrate-binding protein [Aquaticitalea sp.]
MIKRVTTFLALFFTFISSAQDYSSLWEGYFSYYLITDVVQAGDKIYASSENAVFSYEPATHIIKTITTIDGLSGQNITTIHYSEAYRRLVIGYQNGLMEVYSEADGSILRVVDILEKETLPPTSKRINHFNEHDGMVYIATNYGISVYDLQRLEFGDSYFIGNGGMQIVVNQTTIFNGYIYAACWGNNAIKKAAIDNPNLIDYQQWQTISSGNLTAIQSVGQRLYVTRGQTLYEIVNDNLNQLFVFPQSTLDMKASEGYLVVTTQNSAYVYDESFNSIATAISGGDYDTSFTAATVLGNNIYIGTSSFGVLTTGFQNTSEYTVIRPNGPLRNNTFKVHVANNTVWATYGDYDLYLNPYPVRSYGFSRLVDSEWINTAYDSVLTAKNLCDIAVNPSNPSQIFISSFFSGLLEVENGVPTFLYDQNNSGLESLVLPGSTYTDLRVGPSAFDRNGLLWTMTSLVERPLKSFNPSTGQWQGYSFSEIIPDPTQNEMGFCELVIDNNGTKWTASVNNGVIAYNETMGNNRIKRMFNEEHNMPSFAVRSLAMDHRNQLWIGTYRGLRVLYNTSNFLTDPNPHASEIVIVEEGVPKELLALQFISDIKVDGSNNKWVGTADSGVFYLSSDGRETIYHFTTNNSPLPSNQINDIFIDSNSGKVFIATNRGLVSFFSGGSKTSSTLSEAFA